MRIKTEARSIFTSSAPKSCMKTLRNIKPACLTHTGLIFQAGQDTDRHNGDGYWHDDLRPGPGQPDIVIYTYAT